MEKLVGGNEFIPTLEQWGLFFSKWQKKMAQSLRKYGSEQDCRDAVTEAFLKVSGLSSRFRLEKPLTQKTEGEWYGFLCWHARSVLCNAQKHDRRCVFCEEIEDEIDRRSSDVWRDVDDEPSFKTSSRVDRIDDERLRREFRGRVKSVCREAGVTERDIRAFWLNVFYERSGDEVVARIPALHTKGNLYVVKNRIMSLLSASQDRFRESRELFSA